MTSRTLVAQEKIEAGRRVKLLREHLKISRSNFAIMCGFGYAFLAAKENERIPLREEELLQIKMAVKAHLEQAAESFLQTFDLADSH